MANSELMVITLWLCQQFAIEAMAIEIVSFPINSMVIFYSYVSLPEDTRLGHNQKWTDQNSIGGSTLW